MYKYIYTYKNSIRKVCGIDLVFIEICRMLYLAIIVIGLKFYS